MNVLLIFIFIVTVLDLTSGASTRVVLLDSGKPNSAVVVKTGQGELLLDQPNSYTELSSSSARPAAAKILQPEEIQARYGPLIASAPPAPKQFLLYFQPDSTVLMPQSEALFNEIELAIKARQPCDVNIIGHADRTGSTAYNIELSLQRARWVETWLSDRAPEVATIAVESYGEEDPLVSTADGVAEPKNRRVEILIR